MSITPISQNIATSYLQPIFSSALQSTGVASASVGQQSDSTGLSPFSQMMNALQQLQQSNPTKFQQVTQQIATQLQSAAQTAQTSGNTAAAGQLNQLANDFSNASKTGQLPNSQDLAQAMGGHHHHHGHSMASAFQSSLTQSTAQNPLSIISSILTSAGVSTTNSGL